MVRAILDGRKTQTRRAMKHQPETVCGKPERPDAGWWNEKGQFWMKRSTVANFECPYGKNGDRMWVRETFSTWHHGCQWHDCTREGRSKLSCSNLFYRATHHFPDDDQKWVPSIFMPRWASRITLEITGVRVERLQDITEADAIAEGATPSIVGEQLDHLKYRAGFQSLWQSINGPDSWAANPWVWVVEFKRVGGQS
jgi:hypothetical protein